MPSPKVAVLDAHTIAVHDGEHAHIFETPEIGALFRSITEGMASGLHRTIKDIYASEAFQQSPAKLLATVVLNRGPMRKPEQTAPDNFKVQYGLSQADANTIFFIDPCHIADFPSFLSRLATESQEYHFVFVYRSLSGFVISPTLPGIRCCSICLLPLFSVADELSFPDSERCILFDELALAFIKARARDTSRLTMTVFDGERFVHQSYIPFVGCTACNQERHLR